MKKSFVIALICLSFLGQISCDNGKKEAEEKIENLNLNLENAEEAKATLQNEFDNLKAEFDNLKIDLSSKDSILSKKDTEIANKQREIQNILSNKNATEAELKKAKELINSLNADVASFKEEIAALKAENDTLKINQERLEGNLTAETKRADDTEELIKSTFSVSNYKITGLKVKGSGKEVETDKAKRIDKIRVSFDLDPNQNADGEKEIFIAIYKPDGGLGKFKGSNPGQIKTNSNGTIDYSDKVSFNYQRGSKQNITFDWEDFDFPKGNYKIDLYQNGMKIGQRSVELR